MTKNYSKKQWEEESEKHSRRFQTTVGDYLQNKREGGYHPVIDFLFMYFSFPSRTLAKWTPGLNSCLQDSLAKKNLFQSPKYLIEGRDKYVSSLSFPTKRLGGIQWTLQLLKQTEKNPDVFNCYGLHEWAMVYQSKDVRHQKIPFRLSQEKIDELVSQSTLQCTHRDALRFYPESALSFNLHHPTREQQADFEQSACLHANMDLYKWAYKLYPWIGTDLLMEAFDLALECRTVDMQASPYDLSHLNYEPIPIETKAGRALYVQRQTQIQEKAKPIRQKLIKAYEEIIAEVKARKE